MGYAGGTKENPTYSDLGDHTETVQVDYDPERITYDRLLEIFWESHKPTSRGWSRQYLNAIFYHDDQQKKAALASQKAVEDRIGQRVKTVVAPLRSFTLAEDYHQKYNLKSHAVLSKEIARIYPEPDDLIASTAAARLNGYTGGYGSRKQLEREIDDYGLSPQGETELENLVWK